MDLIERKTNLTSHQYCHYWVRTVKMGGWVCLGISSVILNIFHTTSQTGHILILWLTDCLCCLTAALHNYWLGCNELSITATGGMDPLEMQCLLLWQCYSFVSACTVLIMTAGVFETCNDFGMLFLNGCVNHLCLNLMSCLPRADVSVMPLLLFLPCSFS